MLNIIFYYYCFPFDIIFPSKKLRIIQTVNSSYVYSLLLVVVVIYIRVLYEDLDVVVRINVRYKIFKDFRGRNE